MDIVRVTTEQADDIAPLVADLRSALRRYKGIEKGSDIPAGRSELLAFLQSGYPIWAARCAGQYIGYVVCRIDDGTLWVEHLYVAETWRRKGVASRLFAQAEDMSCALGSDTVFNFVHPNNDGMFAFLRAKGYTVLNLVEIRKPYAGETLRTKIQVGEHSFDY